jgi:hypothetical protein
MAFGDGSDDGDLRSAWNAFCGALGVAGDLVFKDNNSTAPLQRADAFRFLMQNLGQAFDLALETKDTRYPVVHAFCTPLCKLGCDAADLTYQQAWIDGRSEYRIWGVRGSARFFNITVHGPRAGTRPGTRLPALHEPFGDVPETNLVGEDIEGRPGEEFEIYVGGVERRTNWLPTTQGSRKLFIRQGFDRWDEEPWRFRIERVGMDAPRPMPTPSTVMEAMAWAGEFVTGLMQDWPDNLYLAGLDALQPNLFPVTATDDNDRRGRTVDLMVWRLAPRQALIVEFEQTEAFWMAGLGGVFMNSFDYLYRPVSYTPSRASVDSDGKIRLIMCANDPGYHNWLDTQSFERGILSLRTIMSAARPHALARLVNDTELATALPPDSARTNPTERQAQMLERFHAIQRQRFSL